MKGVVSSGFCLYNFKIAPNALLSYEISVLTMAKTYTTISLTALDRLVYLAFSGIVITEQNNYVELLSLKSN